MAGTLGKLLVSLGLDTSEYKKGLDDASGSTGSFVSSVASGLGSLAFGAAVAGVAAIGSGLVAAVDNAMEAQDVFAQTEAVIKSTGGAAGMSAQAMADLASSLSAANGVSKEGDEAILTGENLLATFTNIGKDVFPTATQTMVDMAQAMGTDVAGGAIQLGKALNDPTKGITALTRVGVTFTEEQQKMIASLQASGDMVGAQKIILAELSKEFGGSAAAAAATFSGQIGTLKDRFGELLEGVGTRLLPMLTMLIGVLNSPQVQAGINAIADAIVNGLLFAVNWLTTVGVPAIQSAWDSIQGAFITASAVITPIVNALFNSELATVVQNHAQVWINLGLTIYNVVSQLASGDIAGAWQALITGLGSVVTSYETYVLSIYTLLSGIGTWLLANLPLWGQALADWITPYIPIALAYLNTLIVAIGAWITAQAATLAAYFMVWATAGGDWVTPYITIALGYLQGLISAVGGWISGQVGTLSAQFATWAVATYNWIVAAIPQFLAAWPSMLNAFLDWIGSAVGPILAAFGLWLVGILQWIAKSGPPIVAQLMSWGTAFIAWIAPQIPGMVAALAGFAVAIIAFIAETTGVIAVKIVEWSVAFLGWVAKNVLPALPGILAGIGNLIYTFIAGVATQAATAAAGIGQGIIDGIKNADWSALGSWISDQMGKLLEAAKNAIKIGSPSKVFSDEVGAMIPAGIGMGITGAAQAMITPLTNLLGTAVDGAKTLVSAVGSTLLNGELKNNATAAGKAAIAGLTQGMLSAVGSAKSAAKSAAGAIVGSFQSALDIHSPSGVFASEVGVPSILGVVEGMNSAMPKVLEWVRGNLGKKLSGYLTNAAAMVRGNLDIFTSLHDLEKLDPFQPLVDSTKALTDAQDSAFAISSQLFDVQDQIAALTRDNNMTTDAQERLKNNQALTKLYQEQSQLLSDQAKAQAGLVGLSLAQSSAQQAANQQQSDITRIAEDAQRQYNDLAAQSQSMMGVDAKRALDFFNMRKQQIQELADLQKQRALATNPDDQKFLDTQIALTKAAQAADSAAATATVNVNVPGGTNDVNTQMITNIINQALQAAGIQTDVRVRTA